MFWHGKKKMVKRIKSPIGVRFCDTDMIGHINNCAIAEYAEYGRVCFFRDLKLSAARLILVNLNIDFVGQMHLEDEVWIETWVAGIGTTSITLAQELFANGKVTGRTRSVVLTFDYENNKPAPVPQELRDALAAYIENADV